MRRLMFRKELKPEQSVRGFTPSLEGQKTVLKKTLKITFFVSLPIVFFFVVLVANLFEKMRPETAFLYALFLLLPFGGAVLFVFVVTLVTLSVKQKKRENPVIKGESFETGRYAEGVLEGGQDKPAQKDVSPNDFKFEKSTFKFKTTDTKSSD